MRRQTDTYSCGPLAACNAVEACSGRRLPLKAFRRACGTTRAAGTPETGLIAGLAAYGYGVVAVQGAFTGAYAALHAHLRGGGAAVLATEAGAHWEAAIGVVGARVLVWDSQPGVQALHVLAVPALRRYWAPSGRGRYALLVYSQKNRIA